MSRLSARRCVLAWLAGALIWPLLAAGGGAQDTSAAPVVYVAEYDGIIHPVASEFLGEAMDQADAAGAAALIVVLRTPGGLLDSTRTIVSRMVTGRTPVVVYVGPGGARAASAGFIVTLAADVAVMAPGTHIGAAHPVSATGSGGDEQSPGGVMAEKAASDVAAYARSLAERRGRNVALAAEAVTESRSFTDVEALAADPPLIDFVAVGLDEVIAKLDGRTVTRFDGTTTTLGTAGARTERVEMSRRQQILSALAHPQVAYILLSLGVLGLTVELWNPGAILPGVAGGVCLLLAFFAFQVLPVNTAGLLLMLFGIALLVLELKVPSFGVLGIGGIASLILGSLLLTPDVPALRIGLGLILPVVLAMAAIFLTLGRLALRSQQQGPVTGIEGMRGIVGRAIEPLAPGTTGAVSVRGEVWRAAATDSVAAGDPVRVVAVDGLTLTVEPAPRSSAGGAT